MIDKIIGKGFIMGEIRGHLINKKKKEMIDAKKKENLRHI